MRCPRCQHVASPDEFWRPGKGFDPKLRCWHCEHCRQDFYAVRWRVNLPNGLQSLTEGKKEPGDTLPQVLRELAQHHRI